MHLRFGTKEKNFLYLLIVEYHRALLFPTFRCPMFCRYCFRKVALNDEPVRLHARLDEALAWLGAHPEVTEVILSGGDPLMLSNRRLDELLSRLWAVGTLRRLRIHSRFPVTLPMRVDAELAAALRRHRPLTLVAHFNHPREITPESTAALARLADAGISLRNQAVLLAGINDDPDTLAELFSDLADRGVQPYYLHHPDLTVGTAHFRVSLDRGLTIARALRGRLSGLAQPTYVLDIPGGGGKVPVDSGFVERIEPGRWRLTSPIDGAIHPYDDPAAITDPPRESPST